MEQKLITLLEELSVKYSSKYFNVIKDKKYSNLSVHQSEYLSIINQYGSITISELAKILQITNASTSIMVSKLISLGYLQKKQSHIDKRIMNVSLTNLGHEFVNIENEIFTDIFTKIKNKLTEDEYITFVELMIKGLNE